MKVIVFRLLIFWVFSLILFTGKSVAQCQLNYPTTITVCPGQNFTVTPTLIAGYNSFSWSGINIVSGATQQNPVINTTTTGTLTVIATGSSCSSQTTTINVLLHNVVQPNINVSTVQPFCSGTNLAASVTNPQANTTYSWSLPGGGTATGVSINAPATTSAGNGIVSGTVSVTALNSITGCLASLSQNVSINQAPDADFIDAYNSPSFALCFNASQFDFVLTNNSSTASTNINYSVNWGNGTSNFTGVAWPYLGEVTRNYSGLGNFPLVVNVTGGNGCSSSWNQTLFNGSNPASGIANPGGTQNLCAPISIQFPLASTVFNNTPGTIYKFWVNDNTDTTTIVHPDSPGVLQQYYTHLFNSSICNGAGNATSFSLYMLAINGCDLNPLPSITPNITIFSKPEADFTIPAQTCVGTPVTLTNTSTGGFFQSGNNCLAPYLKWEVLLPSADYSVTSGTLGNGFPPPTTITTGSNSIGLSFNNTGIHQVRLIARQGVCGNDTIVKSICVQTPALSIVTVSPLSGCSPLPVNTTNTSTGNAICGTLSHAWVISPSSGWSFTNGTNAQSAEPKFSFNNPGTYTITHTVSNGCGPNSSLPITVTVVSPPTVSINPLSASCAPTSVNPTATVNAGGSTSVDYLWQFPNGNPTSSTSLSPGSISYTNAGNSTITLTVTNQCGTQTATLPLVIPAPPAPPQISPISPVCVGQSINLQISNAQSGLTYQWSGPNGYSNTGSSIQLNDIQLNQAGNYTVTAFAGNCSSIPADVLVQVNPAPVISVSPSAPFICPGSTVSLTASGADFYTWSPATGLSATNQANVTTNPSSTTTYTITGTVNGNSCPATTTVTVNIYTIQPITTSLVPVCNQPIPTQITGFSPSGGVFSTSENITLTASGVVTPISAGTFVATYTFTDANGCITSQNFNIVVQNAGNPNVGPDVEEVCQNSPELQLSPTSGTWSGSAQVSTGGSFQTNVVGTFNLTYSEGQGSCLVTVNKTIIVNPLPDINVIEPIGICTGQIGETLIGLSAAADQFEWFESGNSISNSNQVYVTPSVSTNYTLVASISATGCSSQQTVTVNVSPTPDALFTIAPAFCSSSTIMPMNQSQPSNATFTWTLISSTTTTSTAFEPVFTNLLNGNYQLQLIVTVGSCSDTSTIQQFEVFEPPFVSVSNGSYDICSGNNIPLTANVIGTESNYSYSWQFGDFLTSTLLNPGAINFPNPVLNDTTISYSITVTGTLCPPVTTIGSVPIEVIPSISFLIPEANGCSPFQTSAPVLVYGQPTSVSLQTDNGFVTNDLSYIFNFTANNSPQTHFIYASATNGCGTVADTMEVNVLPNPVVPLVVSSLPLQGICSGTFAQFASVSLGSIDSVLVNTWFVDGNLISAGTPSFSYQFNTAGSYQVALNVSDGCSDSTLIIPIEVLSQPSATFTVNPAILCTNQTISLNANATNADLYQWNTGDGQSYYTSSASFSYAQPGNYTVSLFVSNTSGICTDSASATIQVFPSPTVSVQANVLGTCVNNWVQFTSTISGATNYNWDFGNTANSVFPNDSSYYTSPGNYTATLTAFNLAGCSAMDAVSVEIFPNPISIPIFDATLNGPLCGTPIDAQLNNLSQGAFSYQWFLDNQFVSNLFQPLIPIQNYGQHTVSLIAATNLGCFDTASIVLNVFEKPQLTLSILPKEGCQILNTNIDPDCINCSELKTQFAGTILSSNFEQFQATWPLPGIFQLQLSGITANGCRDTMYNSVEVFEKPTAEFSVFPDKFEEISQEFTFTDFSESINPVNYEFYVNSSITNYSLPQTLFINSIIPPIDSLSFLLIATTDKGCKDTAYQSVSMNIQTSIYIPDAFTPNDDGINDLFKPLGLNYTDVDFKIFNRWDSKVSPNGGSWIFRERADRLDLLKGWNGKGDYKNIAESGIYLYMIEAKGLDGKGIKLMGRVALVR